MSDKIQVDYRHTTVFYETDLNAVGATTSLTLRPAPVAPAANDAYVRRWGTPYNILDVVAPTTITVRGAGAGSVGRFRFYGQTTGTLLYTITDTVGGALAVVDGAALAAAEPVYCVLDNSGAGTYTVGAASVITLCTDVDPAGLAVQYPREVVVAGTDTITLYVANGGSTYYESTLKYGGARHTPVIGSARYSYFSITVALAAANACAEILDSEVYDESELQPTGIGLAAGERVQSSLGQTPTVKIGVGPRNTRWAATEWNNTTAIYVNPNGADANAGTWQLPKRTLTSALAAAVAGAKQIVVGGIGATSTMTYIETLTVAATRTIEADHLFVVLWQYMVVGGYPLTATGGTCTVRGFDLRGSYYAIYQNGGVAAAYDCDLTAGLRGFYCQTAGANTVRRGKITAQVGIEFVGAANALTVYDCEFVCDWGIWSRIAFANSAIYYSIFRCSEVAVQADSTWNVGGGFLNNTIYGSQYGMRFYNAGAVNVVPARNIITECVTGILLGNAATTLTINYCSIENNTTPVALIGGAVLTQNNPISVAGGFSSDDPMLIDPANQNFGILPASPCYHAALGLEVGLVRVVMYFGGNTCSLDNLILDGGGMSTMGISEQLTYTGISLKWLTILGTQSFAIDCFGTAALAWTIANVEIHNCGVGILCVHDSIAISNSLVREIDTYGIYVSNAGTAVVHCTIVKCQIGIWHDAVAGIGSAMILDSILSNCASYVVGSDAGGPLPTLLSCDVDGSYSIGVGFDANCIFVNPMFIDDEANWHLRSDEGGYPFDSPCLNAASDGCDMGCYLVARGVTDESWDSYTFAFEGLECEEALKAKGQEDFETGRGASSLAVKGHKRSFQLSWPTSHGMTDDFREALELLSTLATSDDQDVTEEQSVIRLHLWPITPMHSEAAVVFDPTTWTGFVAAGIGHRRNAFRGYDLTCQWYPIAGGVLDNATATLTDAGAAWTAGQWAGYWIRQQYTDACGATGYNYFRILDNDATILTLSDPYGRIVTDAAFDCTIESDHKIVGNDDLYYYLEEDSRLLSLTRPAFIDAIRCRLSDTGVVVRGQMGWVNDLPTNRVPNRLDLEEC